MPDPAPRFVLILGDSMPHSLAKYSLLIATALSLTAQAQSAWVLEGTKVYADPATPAVRDGRVVIRGTKIAQLATADAAGLPTIKRAPQCNGGVIVAGFQNSHVHFNDDSLRGADRQPREALNAVLARMLTQYGFTTVFDLASDRDNTLALRQRILAGEVKGPRILTVGLPLFPPRGLPSYIDHFRKELLDKLPQPATVAEATKVLATNFAAGTDGTKLFLVTPQRNGATAMSLDIARAAAEATHRRGKLVFAHPTDLAGVAAALDVQVDVLAHPPLGAPRPWPEALLRRTRDAGTAIVPTLKLLQFELDKEKVPPQQAQRIMADTVTEFGRFVAMGGVVLFGTDVDYMTDFDPTLEYQLMGQAGMSPMQILASLTTAPANRLQEQDRHGRVAAGLEADLVVLDADPADVAENFAKVRCALRAGEVIYSRSAP